MDRRLSPPTPGSQDFADADSTVAVRDLGQLAYEPAFDIQRQLNQAIIDGDASDTLLLVEHEPVITVSNRKSAPGHLVAQPTQLKQMGIEVCQTDRGGDITYHGPGQLVAYPIIRLRPRNLNLSSYMRLLERIIIDLLAAYGIAGQRDQTATGVWVPTEQPDPDGKSIEQLAKVCAMGVRIRRNVTMHGLALNVTTDLSHFQTIVPCGLAGRPVTSMQQLLGDQCPTMAQVKATLIGLFAQALKHCDDSQTEPRQQQTNAGDQQAGSGDTSARSDS